MNIFISQPMRGKTQEAIREERNIIEEKLDKKYPGCKFIDSHILDYPNSESNGPVWYLGRSLILLSYADLAVFAPGWEDARGCCIEHKVCTEYGIPMEEL